MMRRARSAFVFMLVVAGVAVLAYNLGQRSEQTTDESPSVEVADVGETIRPGSPAAPATASDPTGLDPPGAPADARPATVRRLADGDSFDMTWSDTGDRDEVRLFGINAPEGDACYGAESRDILDTLMGSDELLIETIERDEFGRVLGNVWVDGILVNAAMVELGAALALSDGGSHTALIERSQQYAQATASGLWSPAACGADPNVAVSIVWIESDAPGPDNENKNGEWIEIRNDGAEAAGLFDWSIRDESTRHRYFFPDGFVLDAGASVRVFSGCGQDTSAELYWCDADPVWNNGGDTGFLVDPQGRFADSRSYGG